MKTLLLFTLFFFTLSQFAPPLLPPADFSGPGQIYHPQTGRCLSHALGVGEAAGTVVTLSLEPCEGETGADAAQKPYRRTIWKFKRWVASAAAADIIGPESPSDSVLKAYIVPFSDKYGPNVGTYVLGAVETGSGASAATTLNMVQATEASLLGVWDINYKKADSTFLGNYFSFNPSFYLLLNPSTTITTSATLTTSTTALSVDKTKKVQVNLKSATTTAVPPVTTFSFPIELPTAVSATVAIPVTSLFVFRKVGYSAGDGDVIKDTFIFNNQVDVAQFAGADGNDDRISFILALDSSAAGSKKKGIHNNLFFSLQGSGPANNISALCTTKYNNSFGISWDFYESYNFENKQLNNLLLPPFDDSTPTGAIRIVATSAQLLSCGFVRNNRVEANKTTFLVESWTMDGKVGYVDTNTRSGFYWNVNIQFNDQMNDNRIYIDNPDSHYWFFDSAQTVKIPSFGRITVFNVNATDLKPLANGASVPIALPTGNTNPYRPINEEKEIFVRDYLIYQLSLENTADNYTISNLKAYAVQRKLNPNNGLVEDFGGVEITPKEGTKVNNALNFTIPLEKLPTGEYKLLLQYNIAVSTTKRILAEEDRRAVKTEVGSTVMGLKIVNDVLAGEWIRFLGLVAAALTLVFIA